MRRRALARRLARLEAQLSGGVAEGALLTLPAGMRGLHTALVEMREGRAPPQREAPQQGVRGLRAAILAEQAKCSPTASPGPARGQSVESSPNEVEEEPCREMVKL